MARMLVSSHDLNMGVHTPAIHVKGLELGRYGIPNRIPSERGKDGVTFLLEFVEQGVDKAMAVKMRVPEHTGAVLEEELGVIGHVH